MLTVRSDFLFLLFLMSIYDIIIMSILYLLTKNYSNEDFYIKQVMFLKNSQKHMIILTFTVEDEKNLEKCP